MREVAVPEQENRPRRLHLSWLARQTKKDAERAIGNALQALECDTPIQDQLADLADAVDAYREGKHGVAVALATATLSNHRPVEIARRPLASGTSLADIRAAFDVAREGVADLE
jgi:hypothetical protein